jgi:carboxyl-terminal processing protease
MDNHQLVALIEEQAKWIKTQRDKNDFPLNFQAYKQLIEEADAQAKRFDSLNNYKNDLSFKSLPSEIDAFETDETLKDKRENWHNNLQKDIYVEEAVSVLEDLRQHTKNFKLAEASSQK